VKIHQLGVEDALATLHSAREGLTAEEAERRLAEFGPNQVERIEGEPLFKRISRSFTHFFALILWFAAALAFFAESREPGQGMGVLGWAILAVILANGVFSFWQENRAERAIHALRRLLPQRVKVLRDGTLAQISLEQVVPGDMVVLEEGDDVPADCRVIEAFGLKVNAATITGESLGQERDAEVSHGEGPLEAKNILLAGTSVVAGEAKAVVYATGMHTEFGRIALLTQAAQEAPSPLQKEIVHLSRLVALLAALLGIVFFFIGQALGLSFWQNLMFAIGIIVANVPEGLLPTVTLALALATQRMARKNVLIRHLPAVETLGCTTVICTDKTGTLTQSRMAAERLFLGGRFYDLANDGLREEVAKAHGRFFEAAWLCHNLKESGSGARHTLLGDPMEAALVEMARRFGAQSYPRVDEIPFRLRAHAAFSPAQHGAGAHALHQGSAGGRAAPLRAGRSGRRHRGARIRLARRVLARRGGNGYAGSAGPRFRVPECPGRLFAGGARAEPGPRGAGRAQGPAAAGSGGGNRQMQGGRNPGDHGDR
jgi:sodium/potassium-transporting ATPase subunit alpha